jgi:hypothetical protein
MPVLGEIGDHELPWPTLDESCVMHTSPIDFCDLSRVDGSRSTLRAVSARRYATCRLGGPSAEIARVNSTARATQQFLLKRRAGLLGDSTPLRNSRAMRVEVRTEVARLRPTRLPGAAARFPHQSCDRRRRLMLSARATARNAPPDIPTRGSGLAVLGSVRVVAAEACWGGAAGGGAAGLGPTRGAGGAAAGAGAALASIVCTSFLLTTGRFRSDDGRRCPA